MSVTSATIDGDQETAQRPKLRAMKALSLSARQTPLQYAYVEGLKNSCFAVGEVHYLPGEPKDRVFLRLKGRSEKLLLPFILSRGIQPPPQGAIAKFVCTVRGLVDESTGESQTLLFVRAVESPNFLDATDQGMLQEILNEFGAQGVPTSPATSGRLDDLKSINTHVYVDIAGFPVAVTYIEATESEQPMCLIRLRQSADASNLITVRFVGRRADQVADEMTRRIAMMGPVAFHSAEYRVMNEKIVEGDVEKVVRRNGYIQVRQPAQPGRADMQYLQINGQPPPTMSVPQWLVDRAKEIVKKKDAMAAARNQGVMSDKTAQVRDLREIEAQEPVATAAQEPSSTQQGSVNLNI